MLDLDMLGNRIRRNAAKRGKQDLKTGEERKKRGATKMVVRRFVWISAWSSVWQASVLVVGEAGGRPTPHTAATTATIEERKRCEMKIEKTRNQG